MTITKRISTLVCLLLLNIPAYCQDVPIGFWDSHLPYNTAIGVSTDGNTVYTIGNQAMFSTDANNPDNQTPYSKTDGMSDIGMQAIGYDAATSTVILAYDDGNIDLFKDNTFYNIPYLKLQPLSLSKKISQVYTENGIAYLCYSFGILMIDLSSHEITNTIEIIRQTKYISNNPQAVTGMVSYKNSFYAATANGLYYADKNSYFYDASVWKRIDSTRAIERVAVVGNTLYASSKKGVYVWQSDSLKKIYAPSSVFKTNIRNIDTGNGILIICEYSDSLVQGSVKKINVSGSVLDSVYCEGTPLHAVMSLNNTLWIADSTFGLRCKTSTGDMSLRFPPGPSFAYAYDIYAHNRDLYIAHGEYTDLLFAGRTRHGVSYLHDGKWTLYTSKTYPRIGDPKDIVAVTRDESTGDVYAGSLLDGLVILKSNGNVGSVNHGSIFSGSFSYGPDTHEVIGLNFDRSNNLWVALTSTRTQLYAKTPDSTWYRFSIKGIDNTGPLVVDDAGQVYVVASLKHGIGVYHTNGTLADTTDDANYQMLSGKTYGNLPSNSTNCLAKDKAGLIWVGTDNGVAIIRDCKAPFTQASPCEAELPVVYNGVDSGYLLEGSSVRSICVDELNRKWLGTDLGVWVVSADGKQILRNYNTENSPLPSNNIQKIAIDKITGDVYIGTYKGLVNFHDEITAATTSNDDFLIYPNPVLSGYTGKIAIRNLEVGTDIRITDINGQLAFKTITDNGQAIWDGLDYTGHKVQSGVYMVFITSPGGKQTHCSKLVFLQ